MRQSWRGMRSTTPIWTCGDQKRQFIRRSDGNPGTTADPTWRPLSPNLDGTRFSPAFPAYISSNATFGAVHSGICGTSLALIMLPSRQHLKIHMRGAIMALESHGHLIVSPRQLLKMGAVVFISVCIFNGMQMQPIFLAQNWRTLCLKIY